MEMVLAAVEKLPRHQRKKVAPQLEVEVGVGVGAEGEGGAEQVEATRRQSHLLAGPEKYLPLLHLQPCRRRVLLVEDGAVKQASEECTRWFSTYLVWNGPGPGRGPLHAPSIITAELASIFFLFLGRAQLHTLICFHVSMFPWCKHVCNSILMALCVCRRHRPQMHMGWLRQDVHKVIAFESTRPKAYRGKTVQV